MIRYMTYMHIFFVTVSRSYVGPYTWRDRLYYPIAYCKFMWLVYGDFVQPDQEPNG